MLFWKERQSDHELPGGSVTSTWKWHLILVEDLMSFVCVPDLKKVDKWEEIMLSLMSQSSYSRQIYELSTFLQDLGNQADINYEVIIFCNL